MCPYCKSENVNLKPYHVMEPKVKVEINLKPDPKYYSNTARIMECRSCKKEYLLTMEYVNCDVHWCHRKKEEVEVAE